MNSRPPGRSRPATTCAQRAMSGSQHSAPIPVYTRSNGSGPSAPAASYTSASTKRTSAPARAAIRRASASEAGERHGVGADVALQVDATQAADVTQQRQVEPHYVAEMAGVAGEPVHRVVTGGRVRGGALVPARAVQLGVVFHRPMIPRGANRPARAPAS